MQKTFLINKKLTGIQEMLRGKEKYHLKDETIPT